MNTIYKKIVLAMLLPVLLITLASCNKDLERPAIATESGQTIADVLLTNPNYSIFNAALTRAGLLPALQDTANRITIFVPDDNAMINSGFPLAAVNALPVATLTSILQYHIVGSNVTYAAFGGIFPNSRIPTSLALDPTNPLVRMSIFPSMLTAVAYANNVPVTAADRIVNNGVIHTVATIIAPPTRLLKDTINRTANLSIFSAAILRGDSGQVGLNRFDSLLNYGVTNMTVLAPSDTAFKTLINGLSGGLVPLNAPNATFIGFLNTPAFVTAATVRGILAYHFFATNPTGSYAPNVRVFSVNFSTTPTFMKTLVNGSVSVHPGVLTQSFFTGPIVDSVKFTGLGTFPPGGPAFGGAPATARRTGATLDRHAVNGVFHVIDRVLLPQ